MRKRERGREEERRVEGAQVGKERSKRSFQSGRGEGEWKQEIDKSAGGKGR